MPHRLTQINDQGEYELINPGTLQLALRKLGLIEDKDEEREYYYTTIECLDISYALFNALVKHGCILIEDAKKVTRSQLYKWSKSKRVCNEWQKIVDSGVI